MSYIFRLEKSFPRDIILYVPLGGVFSLGFPGDVQEVLLYERSWCPCVGARYLQPRVQSCVAVFASCMRRFFVYGDVVLTYDA